MLLFFLILTSLIAEDTEHTIQDCDKYCTETIKAEDCVINPKSCKATCNSATYYSIALKETGYDWLTQTPIFCGDKILHYRAITENVGGFTTVTNKGYDLDEKTLTTLCENRTWANYKQPNYHNFTCSTIDPVLLCPGDPEMCKNTLSCNDIPENLQISNYKEYAATCVCGDKYWRFQSALPACNNETQCPEMGGYIRIDEMAKICRTYDEYCPPCSITKCDDESVPKTRIGEYNCKECYCPAEPAESEDNDKLSDTAEIAIILSFSIIFICCFAILGYYYMVTKTNRESVANLITVNDGTAYKPMETSQNW